MPETQRAELERFPPVLFDLLMAELAAGNHIVELGHGFPAAPIGAYALLASPVTTRPRTTGAQIRFHDYNTPTHSGRFTDATGHFFVLEPPHPPEPEPNMDEIRARSRQPRALPEPAVGSPAYTRFRKSMEIDYEKWREGIGYDLDAINEADEAGRQSIELLMLGREPGDWRDIEALAALGTEKTERKLKAILAGSNNELKQHVIRYAPHLVSPKGRKQTLIRALEEAVFYYGLSQALDEVIHYHPPEVMDALFRGALRREGEVAVHFAARIFYLHGKSQEPFDWNHRAFFLRFHAPLGPEREAVFRQLCEQTGADAGRYLARP